jgi:NAD(P)-dependent dehydrogenase (short-subunit alcohol dehydrogenase family)
MIDPRRVVLITGCSTGIGRASATYFAARGWRVIATARRIETIHDLANENVETLALDVADESSRTNSMEQALRLVGRLDALVNNAAYSQAGPLAEVRLDEMRAQFETNLFGAFHLAQLAVRQMQEQGSGRIINVSSIVARKGFPFSGLYCGTKWAMEAMSDAMRVEVKPFGVNVILVEPGAVATPFGKNAEKYMARFKQDSRSMYRGLLDHSGTGIRDALDIAKLGSPPETVARTIYRAASDRFPRSRYQATWDAWLAWPLAPLIPDWLADLVIARIFGLNGKAARN